MTAKRPSTNTNTAKDLRLITDTDLTKLDPGLKHRRQILNQLPEINTAIRCKIKQYLVIIKGILRIDQLHLKPMLTDLLLADLKSLFLLPAVLSLMVLVLLRCNTENLLQRMDHLVLLHAARLQDNTAILHTTGSLHDHMIADLHLVILRIKIINLTNVTKSDSNYLFHSISP